MAAPLRFSLSTLIVAVLLISLYLAAARLSTTLAGHALLALLFAVLGGCLALWLSRRKPVGAAEPLAV